MPKLKFNAWLVHWSGASLPSFEAHAHLMSRVYPCWYLCSPAGQPLRRADSPAPLRQRVKDAAAAHGVEVWPLISNYNAAIKDFDPALRMGPRASTWIMRTFTTTTATTSAALWSRWPRRSMAPG